MQDELEWTKDSSRTGVCIFFFFSAQFLSLFFPSQVPESDSMSFKFLQLVRLLQKCLACVEADISDLWTRA
jgi:hypothetical protein